MLLWDRLITVQNDNWNTHRIAQINHRTEDSSNHLHDNSKLISLPHADYVAHPSMLIDAEKHRD